MVKYKLLYIFFERREYEKTCCYDNGRNTYVRINSMCDALTTTSNDGTEKVYTVTGEDEITDADGTVYVSTKG